MRELGLMTTVPHTLNAVNGCQKKNYYHYNIFDTSSTTTEEWNCHKKSSVHIPVWKNVHFATKGLLNLACNFSCPFHCH